MLTDIQRVQRASMVIDEAATDATDGYLFKLSHSTSLLEHAMMEHSWDCLGFFSSLITKHALSNLRVLTPFDLSKGTRIDAFSGVAKSLVHTQISQSPL